MVLSNIREKKTKKSLFSCDNCIKCFSSQKGLKNHKVKKCCFFDTYTCEICDNNFVSKQNLKRHITAHIKNHFQCWYCQQKFENGSSLKNHICLHKNTSDQNHLLDTQNQSRDKSVKANNRLISNKITDNLSSKLPCYNELKCQICNKLYKSAISYKKHVSTHNSITTNNLNSENIVESNKNDFSVNNKINAGLLGKKKKKFKYECENCGKGFLKFERLKIHILNIHQGVNYECKKCHSKFSSEGDLTNHVNGEDCKLEDLSSCNTCGKTFTKKDYLKKHQYMHMNVLYKCKYCYCAFMKEKSYKKHMEKMNCSKSARKIRMAEFNFKKCRLCEEEFESEENLITHFRTSHIGSEPHQCFCCDSCLPTFQDLQNHIHLHNIQKYTCNLCGKPYTSQEGFRKHRLKHKGAEFKCQFCNSEFLNERRFKFHEQTCKKNPDLGYEPSLDVDKSKKKGEKPKQSRQLHWESRIIMKRFRGDPQQTHSDTIQLESNANTTFFEDDKSDSEDDNEGWFDSYYKTNEDDIAFGLKASNETTEQNKTSDFGSTELSENCSNEKFKKTDPVFLDVNSDAVDNLEVDNGSYSLSESSSEDTSSESGEDDFDIDLPVDYDPKKCRLCVINFSQEYELLHHFIKNHPGEYAHKCPQCEVQSPLYAQLKEHLKSHGIGIGIYNCDNCSKQFKDEKKMKKHNIRCKGISLGLKKSALGKNSLRSGESCKRCGKKFQTKFSYKRHKQLCKKQILKSKHLEKPGGMTKNVENKEDNFNDDVADSNDLLEPDPEDHTAVIQPSENEKQISDSDETKSSDPSSKVIEVEKQIEPKNNYSVEPPLDSFPCRLCEKKFQYERGIVMHFKSSHPGHKPLVCHVCNMHLADKLKEHLKTHGIGEEFICELCGKRFNQKFLSKIHEMWHQGIEYKCNNCKQKFLNKEKMDKHIAENRCSNRQSLMRLPCDICGKSYRSKFGLNKHYITHTPKELRPVKNRMNCEYCGKWFEYNNGLQRHRRIHTGERPYCCRFCPKAFAQEGNCKAHERIHTGESKPRKRKQTTMSEPIVFSQVPHTVAISTEVPTISDAVNTSTVAAIGSITYPAQINLYIYNNIDASGIVH